MIIPKRRVCDICDKDVGYRSPYIVVKKKVIVPGWGADIKITDNLDICETCWEKMATLIKLRLNDEVNKVNDNIDSEEN